MIKRFLISAAVLVSFGCLGANAASISSAPESSTLQPGDSIVLTITGEFLPEGTLGGGLDIDWDPTQLQLLAWNPVDWGDGLPFLAAGEVDAIAGSISGAAAGSFEPVSGPVTLATIEFQIAPGAVNGATTVVLGDDADGPTPAGPFVSGSAPFGALTPSFSNSVINVEVSPPDELPPTPVPVLPWWALMLMITAVVVTARWRFGIHRSG